MTATDTQRSSQRTDAQRRRLRLPPPLARHVAPLAILLAATAVLLRTWTGDNYPGGADSAFLYSGIDFYHYHNLSLFTVWLPSPFGQVSNYSLYWLLSMFMTVVGSALTLYKITAWVVAIFTCCGMYAVTWSWSRSRFGATVASIIYAFSPLATAEWMSGHLDVLVSMALGPVFIWSVVQLLNTGSRRSAVGLGLCSAALLLLTTGQAAYWLLASVEILLGKLFFTPNEAVAVLRRSVKGFLLALAVFATASAAQFGPWLFGARAAFLGGSGFSFESLAEHAKYAAPFGQGIIGYPEETWLAAGSHVGAVSYASLLYVSMAIVVLILSALSLFGTHRRLCVTLVAPVLAAWLLAAGPDGPAGAIYRALWRNSTYFSELSVPNRWLMVSTFCISTMTACSVPTICAAYIGKAAAYRERSSGRLGEALRRYSSKATRIFNHKGVFAAQALALWLVAATLLTLNGGAILAAGLPVIRPPIKYVDADTSLIRSPGDWRVLNVPFNQPWMKGPRYGDYLNNIADIGNTGSLYNGRSTVGSGGWDPRAARFASFLYSTINSGIGRRIADLLGAVGIKYVVISPEPPKGVPHGQAQFLYSQQTMQVLDAGRDVTILKVGQNQSQVTQPSSSCVVAGGYRVLFDLLQDNSFEITHTAVYFADQVIATSGWRALYGLIERSHCLIVGPGGDAELAVLGHAIATVQAASIAPSAWIAGPIDPLFDSQADPASAVELPAAGALRWSTFARSGGAYRVWLRVLRDPDAGPLRINVNGSQSSTVSPTASATLGYQWLPAGVVRARPGPLHIVVSRPAASQGTNIAALALVCGKDPPSIPTGIPPSWRIVDHDSLDADVYSRATILRFSPITTSAWRAVPGILIRTGRLASADLTATRPIRPQLDLAAATIPPMLNPQSPVAFEFRGVASDAWFYLNFYFRDGSREALRFRDTSRRSRLLFFTPQQGGSAILKASAFDSESPLYTPDTEIPEWGHLKRITLSMRTKYSIPGVIRISGPFALALTHPLPYFTGRLPKAQLSSPGARLMSPIISTNAQLRDIRSGILDFSQSFSDNWELRSAPVRLHTVELGFENSFIVAKDTRSATLDYSLANIGRIGTLVSLATWIIGLISLILWPSARNRRTSRRSSTTPAIDGDSDFL